MKRIYFSAIAAFAAVAAFFLTRKNNTVPSELGVVNGELAPAPASSSGVSSQTEGKNYVVPFPVIDESRDWNSLLYALEQQDNKEILTKTSNYVHAVFSSPVMCFKDDVEFYFHREAGHIDVRAAARLGKYDMGVNRRRVEDIRWKYLELMHQ